MRNVIVIVSIIGTITFLLWNNVEGTAFDIILAAAALWWGIAAALFVGSIFSKKAQRLLALWCGEW